MMKNGRNKLFERHTKRNVNSFKNKNCKMFHRNSKEKKVFFIMLKLFKLV